MTEPKKSDLVSASWVQCQQPLYQPSFVPSWARSQDHYAKNLLECSNEPIEYDDDDEDYRDNCFFFPEDCSWSPPPDWSVPGHPRHSLLHDLSDTSDEDDDAMIPGLPDIKMLDAEALGDLLDDNLCPPEITSILVFATNGAIFAHASTSLSARQLRNLAATYGAAYTSYAKNASSGNLTGVRPASHPSSYVTAQSVSLGDVGSIVFELDGLVAVVTKIADRVLLAAVGPCTAEPEDHAASNGAHNGSRNPAARGAAARSQDEQGVQQGGHEDEIMEEPASAAVEPPLLSVAQPAPVDTAALTTTASSTTTTTTTTTLSTTPPAADAHLETQYEIDRRTDLARLANLNLAASPEILLALEFKSAALGKFLSQKLHDLQSPEDF